MFFQQLLILLIFVWISRKIFQYLQFPTLFGEVFAGLLVGPLVLQLVSDSEPLRVLSELGVFFLMFHSGLETNPKDILRFSRVSFFVALGGIILPFLGAYLVSSWFGYDLNTSFFVVLVLSVTAAAISARLLKDSKISQTPVAHVIVTAAHITEILMLFVFSLFLDVNRTGAVDFFRMGYVVAAFVSYFVVVFYVGHRYFKHLYRIIHKGNKGFTFAVILALLFGVVAELIGLHMIIGAFLAGLFLHQEFIDGEVYTKIEDRIFGLSYSFLGPIFFATLAFHLDLDALDTLPWFVLCVFLVAVFGKILGSGVMAFWSGLGFQDSLVVGLGMGSRGVLELIMASIGFQEGIIDAKIFSVLVLVSFSSTVVSTLAMKPLIPRLQKRITRAPPLDLLMNRRGL
ncbi:MAG: cation:proton antiporter [bacterium]|nr:cation:proton antiporter [bacterium]